MIYKKQKSQKNVLTLSDQYERERNFFKISFEYSGPQDQLVYISRFPISYKNLQLISQRVSFSNYFDWMGQVREYSLRPIMDKIIRLTRRKRWGLATNSVKLKIHGFLKADDILEVRLWLDKITGFDNIYHLSFDWLKFVDDDLYERVAISKIIVSCVKIVEHGKAIITQPPEFLRVFFNNMKPKSTEKKPLKKYETLFNNVDFGKKLKDYSKKPLFVAESSYQTSLEHSNLMGNIYFSNYSKWINSTKDLFLYKYKPEFFYGGRLNGEFISLECKVSHVGEAMPFDKVLVKMYMRELYEKGISLSYEVFKVQDGLDNIKLANCIQSIIFVSCDAKAPIIKRIPSEIVNIFKTISISSKIQ